MNFLSREKKERSMVETALRETPKRKDRKEENRLNQSLPKLIFPDPEQ